MTGKHFIPACLLAILGTAAAGGQAAGFLGLRVEKGDNLAECAIVEQLAPGGPAQRAGLLPGDVISSIGGVAVDCDKAQRGTPLVANLAAGETVTFEIRRAGKTLSIPVIAGEIPALPGGEAQDERARMEAGRAVLDRLVRTQEVFTINLLDGGGFAVTGKMTGAEAEDFRHYLEEKGDGAMFPKAMKTKRQDMYLRFDREKGAVRYEFVDATPDPQPQG